MASFDTSRAPLGLKAAKGLVDVAIADGDFGERHYIELKSTLDLKSKRDQEKIAKFILGAANRMPDLARRAFEGYAVMMIGVAKGHAAGIDPFELLDLECVVERFLGASGPVWDVMWVPLPGTGRQVLLIVVDPPRDGQQPFLCRATGETLTDGRIYLRAEGQTREAKAAEVDRLLQRGGARPPDEVEVSVEVLGEISAVFVDHEQALEPYIRRVEKRLLEALPQPLEDERHAATLTPMERAIHDITTRATHSFYDSTEPETRTEEEYRRSIAEWSTAVRDAWVGVPDILAASELESAVFRIANLTDNYLQAVEVKLHLAGSIRALEHRRMNPRGGLSQLHLPKPPPLWGPKRRSLAPHLVPANTPSQPSIRSTSAVTYINGGSVDFVIPVGDLRPQGAYESPGEDFVLIVGDAALTSIHGEWTLTAQGHNRVYRGEVDVLVTGTRDLTGKVRALLPR